MNLKNPYYCEHCGKLRGHGSDHSQCSKALQRKHKADKHPRVTKHLRESQLNFLCKIK